MPIPNLPLGARIVEINHERGATIYNIVLKDGTPKTVRVPKP